MTKLSVIQNANRHGMTDRRVLLDCSQESERFLQRQFQIMADAANVDSYESARARAIEILDTLRIVLVLHENAFAQILAQQPCAMGGAS